MGADNLIWIDLEMTGLKPDTDVIIEIATIVTDKELNIVSEGPVMAIHQPEELLARMDEWNQRQHSSSGLLNRVRASRIGISEAEARTLEFLGHLVPAGVSPMCGNSICQKSPVLANAVAAAGAFLPLPQPGRQHVEGAGAQVGTRGRGELPEEGHASGA